MFFERRQMGDPRLGDANTHAPHMCQFPYKIKAQSIVNRKSKKYVLYHVNTLTLFTPAPLFSAGVQTMRARICSAFSCDMFARVV